MALSEILRFRFLQLINNILQLIPHILQLIIGWNVILTLQRLDLLRSALENYSQIFARSTPL